MPTIAFWNTSGNVHPDDVRSLALEWDVDILILAENKTPGIELVRSLNRGTKRLYFRDEGESGRLEILTRFLTKPTVLVRDSPGVAIRHYQMPLGESFLVVAVHLSSKLWRKTEDQILASTRITRYILDAEKLVGHSRTIVIGDLNMNPFEAGVVGSEGMHAVMDRHVVADGSRIVAGERRMFFYNPMWSFFGDKDGASPGTYFYNSGAEVNFYWNIFDQVLLRPQLLPFVEATGVNIVSSLQGESLLDDRSRPNRERYSDHLPVICRMKEIMEPANVDQESLG